MRLKPSVSNSLKITWWFQATWDHVNFPNNDAVLQWRHAHHLCDFCINQRSFCYWDVIKSSRYTGGDFMFCTGSYAEPPPPPLPPPAPPPAADSCSRDNFWTTFWISFIFGTIVGLDLQITWLEFGRFSSWPWPRFFKVKYRICYISAISGPIATKREANLSIELQVSDVTNGFHLDHNLDLWILKVKRDLDLWPHTWPWPWIFMVKFWNSCISE